MVEETKLVPGSLVMTSDVHDSVYTSIFLDTNSGDEETCLTDDFYSEICFVVAVLGPHVAEYHRAYVVAADVIGWVLLAENEVVCDPAT
jgi:hypothetical protein